MTSNTTNGKTKTITLVGGNTDYDSESSNDIDDNENYNEKYKEEDDDDVETLVDDLDDSVVTDNTDQIESMEPVEELTVIKSEVPSTKNTNTADYLKFIPEKDSENVVKEFSVDNAQLEEIPKVNVIANALKGALDDGSDIVVDIEEQKGGDYEGSTNDSENESSIDESENESENDIESHTSEDIIESFDKYTKNIKSPDNGKDFNGGSDSDSMYGGSDDLSVTSIDSAAILSADPLYFRLTKFLTHGHKNVAEILSHNEVLLSEMNNNLGNIHKALLEINKTMKEKNK